MATRFTGGCLCGRVRYECSADPLFMGNCHCRDCQKASGGAYEPDIGLPAAALKITGAVKYYDGKADSGNTLSRGFCPECGASEFSITAFCSHPHFDLIEDEPELEPRAQEYFDSFDCRGTCTGCGKASSLANFELA